VAKRLWGVLAAIGLALATGLVKTIVSKGLDALGWVGWGGRNRSPIRTRSRSRLRPQRGIFREVRASRVRCGISAARSPRGHERRCYQLPHRFYCGADLHARTMFVHVLNRKGKTVFAEDLSANPTAFLKAIQPYRKDQVVGVECMFAWYWLADLCERDGIPSRWATPWP
jgi:hypothetical protein